MWLFNLVPQSLFYLLFLASGTGYCVSLFLPTTILQKQVKIASIAALAISVYLLGMLYVNNYWKDRAEALQAQVAELEAKSSKTNTVIKNRLVTRTETIRVRGDDIVKYVDREVTKYDAGCVIPPEFVDAHNRAAEQAK
jgi:hypothetical protein